MFWRRRTLMRKLRDQLFTVQTEARARGFEGYPDVIAHSFGTWLFGHLLKEELHKEVEERLCFGRVILLGCILRPDFDWQELRDAGVVQEVLNHFGSKDPVVPCAHFTIWDSGPSGRQGFDIDQDTLDQASVINVKADGYGHSHAMDISKRAEDFHADVNSETMTLLQHSYENVWEPFLTLDRSELYEAMDTYVPESKWRSYPWLLRGTLFPIFAMPLLTVMLVCLCLVIGQLVTFFIALWVAGICTAGLLTLIFLRFLIWLNR